MLPIIILVLFLASCEKEKEWKIEYPESGFYGPNLLSKSISDYNNAGKGDMSTSLFAKIPPGSSLKVVFYNLPIENIGGADTLSPQDIPYSCHGMPLGQPDLGWVYTIYNTELHKQEFTTTKDSCNVDLHVILQSRGSATLNIYENGSPVPSRVKTFKW